MSADALDAAVAVLQSMIDADGYTLRVAPVDEAAVDLFVSAGPDACEDCLVPKPLMIDIANAQFAAAGRHVRDLHYPTD